MGCHVYNMFVKFILYVLCVLWKLHTLLYVNLVYRITYISNKPSLMVECAFSLMTFVGQITHARTFCTSLGIMSTARSELPYPRISKAKLPVKTSQREKLSSYIVSHV